MGTGQNDSNRALADISTRNLGQIEAQNGHSDGQSGPNGSQNEPCKGWLGVRFEGRSKRTPPGWPPGGQEPRSPGIKDFRNSGISGHPDKMAIWWMVVRGG